MVHVPIDVVLARAVHRRYASAARLGQTVKSERALPPAHRRVAGSTSDQDIGLRLIHEGVDLVGTKRLGDDLSGIIQGRVQIDGIQGQQSL